MKNIISFQTWNSNLCVLTLTAAASILSIYTFARSQWDADICSNPSVRYSPDASSNRVRSASGWQCLSGNEFNLLSAKCKERGLRHLLFTGDSRTIGVMRLLNNITHGATCVNGASGTKHVQLKHVECNYHCTLPDGLLVDFWWNFRLNDSLADMFRNVSADRLQYSMKRPDAVLFTTGLHNFYHADDSTYYMSLRYMHEVEANMKKLASVLSGWPTVYFVEQLPVQPHNKHGVTPYWVSVINLIARSTLEAFPKVRFLGGLWDIAMRNIATRNSTFLPDGTHYDEYTNKCLLEHILHEICL